MVKKIVTLIFVGLLLAVFFRIDGISAQVISAQPPITTCGGLEGLICPPKFVCIYDNGSEVAPLPDALGKCRIRDIAQNRDCKNLPDGSPCDTCQPCEPGKVCPMVCLTVESTCQAGQCAPVTSKITPTPSKAWEIAPVTAGTADLCKSVTLSDTNLGPGENLKVTAKSTSSDIVSFGYWIYNMDNIVEGKPKAIRFTADTAKVAGRIVNKQISDSTADLTINFSDINRKDLNWNYYMPSPKRIRVDAYFRKAGTNAWSKYDAGCSKVFRAATVDPTPTPNPSCLCGTTNDCATACFFDKFPAGVTYSSPVKCNSPGAYSSVPTNANKNRFCRNYLRVRGDANGDGRVNILDYFYYVSATAFGAKMPPNVNIDFNGDGVVSSADKAILMKSLKP